ncbi:MAG: hypothetical protein RhofKO_29550 [Rhodothermales bacterium]
MSSLAYNDLLQRISGYDEPSFEELLELCIDYGLVTRYRPSLERVQLVAVTQGYELGVNEADILLQGLLLGYFFGQSGDDLTQAEWLD